MKRFLFSALALALLATGCEKQSGLDTPLAAGTEVTISVNMAADAVTRAEGDATLTYYLEAHYRETSDDAYVLYKRYDAQDNGQFDIRLVTGEDFMLVAWADYDETSEGGCYNTTDLCNITVNEGGMAINNELRDAFSNYQQLTVTATTDVEMVLTRPFARINVTATDLEAVQALLKPTMAVWTYTSELYTAFDAMTGEASELMEVELAMAADFYSTDGVFTFDYILAPLGDRALVDFNLDFYQDDVETGVYTTSYKLPNIPYERNYQTNIVGNLFTKEGNIDITVDPEWESPDYNVYLDVDGVQEIIGSITEGSTTDVILGVDIEEDAEVIFPNQLDETTVVNLVITGIIAEDATLVLDCGAGNHANDFAGKLNVTVEEDSPGALNVKITMVNPLVIYGPGSVGSMTVSTNYYTYICKGMTVGTYTGNSCITYCLGTMVNIPNYKSVTYLGIGENTDRENETDVDAALAAYVAATGTYRYAGIATYDGTTFTEYTL